MQFSEWAFRRLYDYVSYKAEVRWVQVEQVNPKNTSRQCSSCGFTHENRPSQYKFCCQPASRKTAQTTTPQRTSTIDSFATIFWAMETHP
ncbi:zinc ribbon domain-containing protein [Halobellus rubicundus]|uniref:Zinc ribbon domain-containing protein n=1 Tax=Halobellus rubicundus TaxID=2996466 RepID=A0ABD5MIT2_9EURY